MQNNVAVFEEQAIRRVYDEKTEGWLFSVVDIIQILTQQTNYQTARKYWNKLKERLKKEGSEVVTNCHQLKMPAEDGKLRLTDVANTETLLRLIQSVPSPKQENKTASKAGGGIAKDARLKLEKKTGKKVITSSNYLEQTASNILENENRVGETAVDNANPKIAQKGRRKKI